MYGTSYHRPTPPPITSERPQVAGSRAQLISAVQRLPVGGTATNRQSDWRTLARLPGLIVGCFDRLWVRGRTQFLGTQPAPLKSESSASKIFHYFGFAVVFKTTFDVFTRAGPDKSLERLTERSVGLVTDQPSDVYELFVTLFQ